MRSIPARAVLAVGVPAACVAALASLTIGVYGIGLGEVAGALKTMLCGGTPTVQEETAYTLVVHMRLPRALGAVVVGSSLGTAGVLLQALLRNPLASPFVIGTSQAAGFGAVLAIFLGLPLAATFGSAFGFSVVAALLVLALSRTDRSLPTESVVLTGLSMSLLFGALIGLVRYLARDEGVVSRISLWILGGLWHLSLSSLALLGPPALAAVVLACLLWRRLDLLALGEADAARLGMAVRRTGTLVLLLSCVLTSLAVCIGGVVAFVGLVVPHAARKLVGPAHGALVPAAAILGAVFVLATDGIARVAVPPQELPLGVVTSLVGVPAFLLMLRSLRSRRSGS